MSIIDIINKGKAFDFYKGKFAAGIEIDFISWGLGFEIGLPKRGEWKCYFGIHILFLAMYVGIDW